MKYLLENKQSSRLRFRLLAPEDFDEMMPLFADPERARFIALDPEKTPEERGQWWFARQFKRYEEGRGGLNVLFEKSTGKIVGQCGLLVQTVDDTEELEIGYSLLPQYRGFGYATEAALTCKDHAFENNFSESLISIIHKENIDSMNVARRNGMSLDKESIFMDMPVHVFRVLKSDWRGQ